MRESNGERELWERTVRRAQEKVRHRKRQRKRKDDTKFKRIKEKQEREKMVEEIPAETWEIIKDTNVFRKEEMEKETLIGPMICSTDISLSKEEIAFLTKGPKFMLRNELDEIEFSTEVEKMIAKQSYGEGEEGENGEEEETGERDKSLERRLEKIEAEAKMTYNKETKSLDMGNLKTSEYKYNRYIFLPRPGKAEKETLHNIRRREMKKVFDYINRNEKEKSTTDKWRKRNREYAEEKESNLTKEETIGLKRLKKRVKEGSIVITETDKSKRFCVLKK